MTKKKNRFDDGFQSYLVEKANFIGEIKMPEIVDMKNIQIPKTLISFSKLRSSKCKRGYIHFYEHDKIFANFIANVDTYIPLLTQYDGVITPDCSLAIGQIDYLQMTNTYFNRAIGVYLQQYGIPIIPNVRWSDEKSYNFCFNGIPRKSIVSISTHGCIKSNKQKEYFKNGLKKMIEIIEPTDVIVYGYMPDKVFAEFKNKTKFHQYENHFEKNCKSEV